MTTSFGALCDDFYINQKLGLKMDLPTERETVLHFCDSVRKHHPSMKSFKRYEDEFALESSRAKDQYLWLALRRTSIRTGHVNPDSMDEAKKLHQLILKMSPYHLTISPMDIDHLELVFGFDLECEGDHDQVVYQALIEDTPMANLLNIDGAKILNAQPSFSCTLNESGDLQAYFEVRTRPKNRRGFSRGHKNDPISLFLSIRKYGPVEDIEDLLTISNMLFDKGEALAADQMIPNLLTPISRHITTTGSP